MTLKHQMINTIRSVKSHMDDDEAKDKKTNETYFTVQQLTKKFRLRKARWKGIGN
jgi:hypothetical protein